MKDKDGFTIKCKYCTWKIYNNREDKDYVCDIYGGGIYGAHLCYGDDYCKHYEPNIKEESENEQNV